MLSFAVVFGRGISSVAIILALVGWTGVYRQVRAEFIKHSTRDYVRSAEAIGASTTSRMFRHILPNVSHVILVRMSLLVVGFIKYEVILSYLGLGVGVDDVSWGTMLAEAQSELILGYWWQLVAATAFMAVFVTAFSMMTDAIRDALDPKLESSVGSERRPAFGRRPAGGLSPRQGRRRCCAAIEAVKGVSFEVPQNTTVALVGESGSGKSVTAMSILNLLPPNAERSGAISFCRPRHAGPVGAGVAEAARQGDRLRLPGPDELAQSGVHRRPADQRAAHEAHGAEPARGDGSAPRHCWSRSACRSRSGASPPIRTSFPAASSSG